MMDPRMERLAETLVNFSVEVKPGDNVLISSTNGNEMLVKALIRQVYKVGGTPFVWYGNSEIERELAMGYTREQLEMRAEPDAALMKKMQCYIGFSAVRNASEMADVPAEKLNMFGLYYNKSVHGLIRVPNTRWVVLRYPTPAMAQTAAMSTEAFERFYFDVCTMDYSRMDKAMDPLKARMDETDEVHIVGNGTDLTFSIKGIGAVKCAGKMNIPDGEIFTAPVRNSVNGVISYNTPSTEDGFTFENVRLTFRDGKIVDAQANDTERVNRIFDRDEGARYVGEFAIGVNPYITKPMNNILFDEKIMGSFHFTPGCCYDECPNGNHSSLHWDLVCIQTPEMGGGEMYFDGKLIRKDGRFVPEELQCLNPENLKN
ncbi:MAG: aminopeptidase [Eubacteriales bacterium]|nr:aminopeptidase [Eubacteriales bacterium]